MTNKGFVSLFIVLLMGLLFGASLAASAQKTHTLSRNIFQFHDSDTAMFDAMSCIHIGRLRIFYEAKNVVGEYDTESGACLVDEVIEESGRIILSVRAEINGVIRKLETAFDSETFEILYIKNVTGT